MSAESQAAAIREFEVADKARGFDFKTGPMMRITLFRLKGDRYRMLWTSHHILFDGWSRAVMMGEFLHIYEGLVPGKSLPSVEDDRYEDYIRFIEQVDQEKEQSYWANYLRPIEHGTLLPFVDAGAERNRGKGLYASIELDINEEITGKVERFAQHHHITVSTLMQGVWSYLLHRYTGSANVVFGVIVSGRPEELSQVEQRVGMFINALPLQAAIREEQPIVEWLQGIQQDQVASRRFQYTPLSKIQGWTGIRGDLFDSLIVFENYPVSKVLASKKWSLEVENLRISEQTNYPLSLVINSGSEINVDFSYNPALLKPESVLAIRGHFEQVLLQLVDSSNCKLGDLEVLSGGERNKLLHDFNNNKAAYPKNKTLVDLFEEQVAKTPDSIAAVFEEQQLTYKELNERSNQLGHYLRSKASKKIHWCRFASIVH
jgi:hypothetical protein